MARFGLIRTAAGTHVSLEGHNRGLKSLVMNTLVIPIRNGLICGALVAALMLSGTQVFAQAPLPEAKPRGEQQGDGSASGSLDPLAEIGTVIPETTLARARMRDDLYALLATAEEEATANKIAERIERLWRVSGSPTVTLLIERANERMKEKDLDTAARLLDAAVELAPDFAEAWNRRAYVSFERGNVRNAVGDLRRVLALDPNHFQALAGLAAVMKEIGNKEAALQAYEKLLEVHPYSDGAQKAYDELRRDVEGQRL